MRIPPFADSLKTTTVCTHSSHCDISRLVVLLATSVSRANASASRSLLVRRCNLWHFPPAILGAESSACDLSSPSPEAFHRSIFPKSRPVHLTFDAVVRYQHVGLRSRSSYERIALVILQNLSWHRYPSVPLPSFIRALSEGTFAGGTRAGKGPMKGAENVMVMYLERRAELNKRTAGPSAPPTSAPPTSNSGSHATDGLESQFAAVGRSCRLFRQARGTRLIHHQ